MRTDADSKFKNMLFAGNDRLAFWYLGTIASWIIFGCGVLVPFFHLGLGVSIKRIVVSLCICCSLQMLFVPWLYYRAAHRNIPRENRDKEWLQSSRCSSRCCSP